MAAKNLTQRHIEIAVIKLYGGGNIHAVTRNAVAKQLGIYPQALEKFLAAETGTNFYEWVKANFIDQLDNPSARQSIVTKDTELIILCGTNLALQKGLLSVTQFTVSSKSKILPQRINYIIGSNDQLRCLVWSRLFFETKDKIKDRYYWEPEIRVARALLTGFAIGIQPAVAALNADAETGRRIFQASASKIYYSTEVVKSE